MTVYVDDMNAAYGRMKMCHMLADTDEELHAMADKIGVERKWWQAPPRHSSHYDIALSKKALAIAAGAVEITWRQAGAMNTRRKITGELGNPWTASAWVAAYKVERRLELAELQANKEGA
jgi:hypothetical protein